MGRISRVWAIGAVVLLAACSDQNAHDVTAPGTSGGPSLAPVINSVCTSASLSDIQAKIHELYVKNSWPDENSILGKLNTVTNYLAAGDLASAQAYMVGTLLPFLTNKYSHLSAAQQVIVHDLYLSLAAELTCYVDIAGDVFDLNPGDPAKSFEITGTGGVWFPGDVVPTGTLVILSTLPVGADPFVSLLDKFTPYLSIELIPNYTFTNQAKLPEIVLCPLGLGGLGNFHVGHQASTGFEILPFIRNEDLHFDPCDGLPPTSGASNGSPTGWLASWMTRAANLLLPESLQASMMMGTLAVGGKGGSFSPFGTTSTTLTALGGKGSSFSPRAMPSAGDAPKAPGGPAMTKEVTEATLYGEVGTRQDSLTTADPLWPTVYVRTQGYDLTENGIPGVKVTLKIGMTINWGDYSEAKLCVPDPDNAGQYLKVTTLDVYTGPDGKVKVPCIDFGTGTGFANIHADVYPASLGFTGAQYLNMVWNLNDSEDPTTLADNGLNWLVQSTEGAATKLVVVDPSSKAYTVAADALISPVVELEDANGLRAYDQDRNVTVGVSSGGYLNGTLNGTVMVKSDKGRATFTNLKVGGTKGQTYTLTFTASSVTQDQVTVEITAAGDAAKLAIKVQPGPTGQAGVALVAAPVIQVQDAYGNLVSGARTITAEIASSPGGQPTGGYPKLVSASAATGGGNEATFSTLAIEGTADPITPYTLIFKSTDPTAVTSITSDGIKLTAGIAAKLAIKVQPGPTGRAGVALVAAPVIQVQDAYGNLVSGARTITAEIASSPGGQPTGGYPKLVSASAATGGGNEATFSTLAIEGTADPITPYTLIFKSTDPTTVTSITSGGITLSAGSANSILKDSGDGQTANAYTAPITVTAKVIDSYQNLVPGVTVNWSPGGSSGTVASPTSTTNSSGVTTATWTLGPGANTLEATINVGTATNPILKSVVFTATGLYNLTMVNGCATGGAKDNVDTYGFHVPTEKDNIFALGLNLSSNGAPGATENYVIRMTAKRSTATYTAEAKLQSSSNSSKGTESLVLFDFYKTGTKTPIPGLTGSNPDIFVTMKAYDVTTGSEVPLSGTNRTVNMNVGGCSAGSKTCKPVVATGAPKCSVIEYQVNPLVDPYRNGLAARVYKAN